MLSTYDYTRELISGALLEESMVEEVAIPSPDYIEVAFKTKFHGPELTQFSEQLRQQDTELSFSDGEEFKRDS